MIGCTKLICGTATVSDIVKYGRHPHGLPPHLLQFSSSDAPLVVWNCTAACNLSCRHCYLDAKAAASKEELSTEQALAFIDDLAAMHSPVLLFSGGEPLMRPDLFRLGAYAAAKNLRPVLSTNGTLITPDVARKIAAAGFQYVGVSIDGTQEIHDRFRGMQGAFQAALTGIRNARQAGCKTGIRFTLNAENYETLPDVLNLLEEEQIPRFCMYHLVYAGRGKDIAAGDTTLTQKRQAIQLLIDKARDFQQRGISVEILTTDNHADGIYIWEYLKQHDPSRLQDVETLLAMHGGCSAGQKMANVGPEGNVHPCQFWGHVNLGNVKEKPFSAIWRNPDNALLAKLRRKSEYVAGQCGKCHHKEVCGGCRIRAEYASGDLWGSDPACYIDSEGESAEC